MSVIDELVKANDEYARSFELGDLSIAPARKLAILACMDARINVEEILRLKPGDAHIIRNAGGVVTPDTTRSLLLSHYLLGTREFMIITHTDCGMLTFDEKELRSRLRQKTKTAALEPAFFYAFDDLEENLREQIEKLQSHPWIPREIPVRGFIYDTQSGRLKEISV